MKKYEMNLCEGSLFKKIAIFSIPLMFSNILQVLFNMSDIAVGGKFAGSLALGSVGSTSILVTLFTGLLIGFAVWTVGFIVMGIWVGYRIVRGWIRLSNAQPMPVN